MEGNIVLANKVVRLGFWVLPPMLPPLGIIGPGRPLLGGRQIADDRVIPDIDSLALAQVINRQLNTPLDVPSDGTIVQALFDPAKGEVQHMVAPAFS